MLSEPLLAAEATPTTNRGVYPHSTWGAAAFDYYRATVDAVPQLAVDALVEVFAETGRNLTPEVGPAVSHYSQHVQLLDRLGNVHADVFWGGQNVRTNVEGKGSSAPAVARALRRFGHSPSRVDPKRDACAPGLFEQLRQLALAYSERLGLAFQHIANHHPDKGDTVYLGSRKSQVCIRIYQPGLKRAQEEGRTGDEISQDERNAVRVEMEFKPQKRRAKQAAASLSPDELWGVSPWSADFAGEVFAMNVQPITISERRESDRNRALRFMATQYRAHIEGLLADCGGDVALLGSTILDLADISYRN